MTSQVKRTLIAQAAMEASDLLNLRFAGRLVGTRTPRKLMVAVPDGPSTDGGKKVRQSIVLAPASDPSAGTVMCGWLDIAQKRAEIRSHALVKAAYEQRWKQPFDVSPEAYEPLMRDVQSMLAMQGVEVARIDALPAGQEPESRGTMAPVVEPPTSSSTSALLYVGVALMLALLVGGAVFALR